MSEFETIEIKKFKDDNGIRLVVLIKDEKGCLLKKKEHFSEDSLVSFLKEHLDDYRQQPFRFPHERSGKIQS